MSVDGIKCLQCFDAVGWAVGGHPACKKTEWWDAGLVLCLGQCADLRMAQVMPLPLTISCSSKYRLVFTFLVFTFLVPAHPGSPGQSPGAVKWS